MEQRALLVGDDERAYMGGGKGAMHRARYCRDCDYYMPRFVLREEEPDGFIPWCWHLGCEVHPASTCGAWSLSQFLDEAAGDYRR